MRRLGLAFGPDLVDQVVARLEERSIMGRFGL